MKTRNPKYDGLVVLKPDLNKLQAGDVFLTRNAEPTSKKAKFQADVIAKATGGRFSHAMICTELPNLIEAIGEGVSNISLQNCFAHELKNVQVLRYRDRSIAQSAGSEAMRSFAQSYSVKAAIASIRATSVKEREYDGIFCSALVALAFKAAGAPEFSSVDPMKVTPATLEKMDGFSDVTADVFVSILSPKNIEDMSALDGDRQLSPFSGQAFLLNSYYEAISAKIAELLERHPTLATRPPVSFFECLPFINALCVASKRLDDGPEPDWVRNKIKSIDDLAFDLLSEGKLQQMCEDANIIDEKSLQYSLQESFKLNPDVSLQDTLGLIDATRKQIASRSSILNVPSLPLGQSRVWDEWVRMTEIALQALNRRLKVLNEVLARAFPTAAGENE
jgi:hypothetical protein